MNRGVNPLLQARLGTRVGERLVFASRKAGRRRSSAFGSASGSSVARLYVINLDRRADRWRWIRQELARVRDGRGVPLVALTRRHRAVDWRDPGPTSAALDVAAEYTLAEQLFVQPVAALHGNEDAAGTRIRMTAQEVAVARSHVEVWRRVAEGPDEYALVLEDDAYFTRRFVPATDSLWRVLSAPAAGPPFDVLLLSFAEIDGGARKADVSRTHFRPVSGLWQLSGYVLSKRGAQRLLRRLPVRGPVDLWMNHQFAGLDVVASRRPLIRQRPSGASSNSYSVLPILTALGVLTEDRASRARRPASAAPVFAAGPAGSGLTALATALSILGYRCCRGVDDLPQQELARAMGGRPGRVFDAYVDVTAFPPEVWPALARAHPSARFIQTVPTSEDRPMEVPAASPPRLVLPDGHKDKWQALADHLGCDYPAHAFPRMAERARRLTVADAEPTAAFGRAPAMGPVALDRPGSQMDRLLAPQRRSGPDGRVSPRALRQRRRIGRAALVAPGRHIPGQHVPVPAQQRPCPRRPSGDRPTGREHPRQAVHLRGNRLHVPSDLRAVRRRRQALCGIGSRHGHVPLPRRPEAGDRHRVPRQRPDPNAH